MKEYLPVIYISVLLVLLSVAAYFVFKQIVKTRRLETTFEKLQKKLKEQSGTSEEYYQLGSLYLDKKLFSQSVKLFEKALKFDKIEPGLKALNYNALGYAYFAQEQYDLAIRNYKEAIKAYPEYVIALNNLANVYEKKQLIVLALETYEKTLKYEAENPVAKRRAESLRKRLAGTT